MAKYQVISECVDSRTGERLLPGDEIELDEDLYDKAFKAGIVGKEVEKGGSGDDEIEGLIKLGGGYYELPNGEKVRGKEKALEALTALEVGDPDAKTKDGDITDSGTSDIVGDQSTAED